MDYTRATAQGRDSVLEGVRNLSLDEILDCGQCFRWAKGGDGWWRGIVGGRHLSLYQEGDRLLLSDTSPAEFEAIWRDYLDLGRDYGRVRGLLEQDPVMARAIAFCPGMRVLRQDPWEALCSFILSQNNNIKRIKGLVERLCEHFGRQVPGGYAFPTPSALSGLTVEDLAPVRAGFRAKYILDAAKWVASGGITLQALYEAPLPVARGTLQQIMGVGPKVAECALLYGLGRVECVPVDVWIGRALNRLYPDGFPEAFGPVAGLAQQYLFHYVRHCPDVLEEGGLPPQSGGAGRAAVPSS